MSSRILFQEEATVYTVDIIELRQQIAALTKQVESLHEKVDELLTDTRKVRPFMNQFLNSPAAKLPGFRRMSK